RATLHAPVLDLNPVSVNPEIADVSRRHVCDSVRLAGRTGFSLVTVHPGRRTAKRPPGPDDLARFDLYVRDLHEVSEETGVKIAMENMENRVNSLVSTPESMSSLLDREGWLSFTLDLCHAMAGGRDVARRYVELCGDRLVNVHVSAEKDGKKHLPPSGDPGVTAILEQLSAEGYDGHLTLEIEDLCLPRALSCEEKISLVSRELSHVKKIFGESTNL
ncbi:MAG: sugar phosphate isomerase/epimerase family protein, partial [Methanolinea sp.]